VPYKRRPRRREPSLMFTAPRQNETTRPGKKMINQNVSHFFFFSSSGSKHSSFFVAAFFFLLSFVFWQV
jgi:hypothetical protein